METVRSGHFLSLLGAFADARLENSTCLSLIHISEPTRPY